MGILGDLGSAHHVAAGLTSRFSKKGSGKMEETMTTADVVIGGLAAVGVVVLIGVFFWVVRIVFIDKHKKDHQDV